MPVDPKDPVFSDGFAATARSGLSATAAATWGATLPRDPRLLVPVDVEALVVPPGTTAPRADVAVRLLRAPDTPGETFGATTTRAAPPFTNAPERPAGVYLQWAMPDGLTAGAATDGTTPDGRLNLPPLPNRWLVVRLGDALPRSLTAWMVESDRGRRVRLADWTETAETTEGATPTLDPAALTAVTGGDPAWIAVYDNVEDRFALYDDLADVDAGAVLSYVVVGWYSRPELDPLHGAGDLASFTRRLAGLQWSVDETALARAFAAAQARIAAAAARDRPSPAPLGGPAATLTTVDGRPVPGTLTAGAPKIPVAAGGPATVLASPGGPRQTLFHGAVHGVRTAGDGGDARPRPEDVRIAAGGSTVEAAAALLRASLDGDATTERLLCALGFRMLPDLARADGVASLDEEVARRAFLTLPGGSVTERIRVGNALTDLRPPARPRPGTVPGGGREITAAGPDFAVLSRDPHAPTAVVAEAARKLVGRGVRFDLVERGPALVAGLFQHATRPLRVPDLDPPRFVTVERALPRWYLPADPALTLSGLARSLRHGHDGRLEPDETLACRLSGDIASGYQGLLAGTNLVDGSLEHGGVPDEADELVREAALRDWGRLPQLVRAAVARLDLPSGPVRARLTAERDLALHGSLPGRDAGLLLPGSLLDGRAPSPVWVTYWRQPWIPLYLEWELALEEDGDPAGWRLGELDLEPTSWRTVPMRQVSGRSLLTSGPVRALAAQITDFLVQESARDAEGTGVVTDDEAGLLRDLGGRAARLDALGCALEGLREHLLGFDGNAGYSEPDADHVEPAPDRDPDLLRGGHARLIRLRAVDAFGRTLELDLSALAVADSFAADDDPAALLLPPRITAPSRLQLRFTDPDDPAVEARVDQEDPSAQVSPVAGWLLPDHVDAALELFDAAGEPAGQMLHEGLGGAVVFEGAPGRPGQVGVAPPTGVRPGNRHLAALAAALVTADAADRGRPPDQRPPESALAALLRAIDTTLWTVDPFGLTGLEHLSLLTGRPIALVRATAELQVRSDVAEYPLSAAQAAARQARFDALTGKAFPVRLGALTRSDDGLLGWFADDDYSVFHPVHPAVLDLARPGGPRTGLLGSRAEAEAAADGTAGGADPITHPWLGGSPELLLRPGRARSLTLLLVPGGAVHVTSGINPRKQVALVRSWIADALARIAPSFRVGPVLVDPGTVRLPRVGGFDPQQVFTRRTDPQTWRDDPIAAASGQALLPDAPAEAHEGYLRVRLEPEEGQ